MVSKNPRSSKQTEQTTTIRVTHTLTGAKGTQRKVTSMTLPGAFRLVFEAVTHG